MEKHYESLLFQKYGGYILLEINSTLYQEEIEKHNILLFRSLYDPSIFVNDGFGLKTTHDIPCENLTKIDYNVRIQSFCVTETKKFPCGMKLYSRNNIITTPLRLANGVDVIDSGCKNIIGMFDCAEKYTLEAGSSIVQLCASSVLPIYVNSIQRTNSEHVNYKIQDKT